MSGANMKGFERPTLLSAHRCDRVVDEWPVYWVVEFERHFAHQREGVVFETQGRCAGPGVTVMTAAGIAG